MTRQLLYVISWLAFLSFNVSVEGREWSDKSGHYKVKGELVAYDDQEITLKLEAKQKGRELLAFPIDQLSEADLAYLQSEEMRLEMSQADSKHSWTLRNGMKVIAKPVEYVRKNVVIQRQRGKVLVNDRLITNLPEVYQRMIPKIVEYFEKRPMPDDKAFDTWMKEQKANARTFPCEGIILEFNNKEEYAFPFFVFEDVDRKILESGYSKWVEEAEEADEKRQHSLYMQSQAAAYQQSQKEQMQVARLQLQLQAVQAGVTDMWEVWLEPKPGVRGYPLTVAVFGRNSDEASYLAMQRNPGYTVGAVSRLSRF
jgi:hypothetical protein